MAKSLPPLTWFRSFEAAARYLSFTTAAEEIGLTQSAVSQQVKSLETRLRVPLFVRQARGLSLTDDGRRLLPQVGAALEALADAASAFEADPTENLLTIATSVSMAQWVLAPNLPDFYKRHPDVRLRILSTIWPDDFHSSRADVEIRFGSSKQVGHNAEPLLPTNLIALQSPLLRGKLEDLPLIEAVGTSSGWRNWVEVVGGRSKPSFYVDTYGMALQLAVHGNGVALVSEILAGNAIRSGQVKRAHAASIPSQEGYFLWADENNIDAQHFCAWLRHQLLQ